MNVKQRGKISRSLGFGIGFGGYQVNDDVATSTDCHDDEERSTLPRLRRMASDAFEATYNVRLALLATIDYGPTRFIFAGQARTIIEEVALFVSRPPLQ